MKHKINLPGVIRIAICLLLTCGLVFLFSLLGYNLSDEYGKINAGGYENDGYENYIYCTDTDHSGLYRYGINLSNFNDKTEALINGVAAVPVDIMLVSALPADVKITGYTYGQDGQLIIDFNEKYLSMSNVDEALCRASVVLTMSQLASVDYVEFTVMGMPVMMNEERSLGLMSAKDFIDSNESFIYIEKNYEIPVYFADETGKMLVFSQCAGFSENDRSVEECVIHRLIKGPENNDEGLLAVLPEGTVLNKIKSADGICYVDFNEHFLDGREGIKNQVIVYSVVNSLCELPGIGRVKITVNNETRKNYGKVDISDFLISSPELIANEKAGEAH